MTGIAIVALAFLFTNARDWHRNKNPTKSEAAHWGFGAFMTLLAAAFGYSAEQIWRAM